MKAFNQNVGKITSATLLALALTACGGGGGGSQSPQTSSTPTKELAEAKANKMFSLAQQRQDVSQLFAENGVTLENYKVSIDGKRITSDNVDLSALGEGVRRIGVTEEAEIRAGSVKGTVIRNGVLHLYQQPYSVVAGTEVKGGTVTVMGRKENLGSEELDFGTVKGYATKTLPSSGKFNYAGEALSQDQTGKFNYTVDFAAKTGSGSISNIAGGITLHEGKIAGMSHDNPDKTSISGYGIESTARSNSGLNGGYKLGFFGPNADEVAGVVTSPYGDVGFGGKKQ